MIELSLSEAQAEREDRLLEMEIDSKLDLYLSAKDVGPEARNKLKNLLKYYAKKPKPFTACVRDNTKRFGKDGAERVCATLKDIIRGTTKWRKGGKHDKGAKGLVNLSETPYLDEETANLLEQLSEQEIMEIIYG